MRPETLAEMNPLKLGAAALILLGLMGLGLLLSNLTGRSARERHEMVLRQREAEAMMIREEMMNELRSDMQIEASDVGAALSGW